MRKPTSASMPVGVTVHVAARLRGRAGPTRRLSPAMVSNDVEALGLGESCEALLLTAKARIVAPLIV